MKIYDFGAAASMSCIAWGINKFHISNIYEILVSDVWNLSSVDPWMGCWANQVLIVKPITDIAI